MDTYAAMGAHNEGARWSPRIGPGGRLDRTPLATSTPRELDRLTYLARERLGVAAVCTTLVQHGELVISCHGVDVPLALLITHALRRPLKRAVDVLIVVDATHDRRLAGNPVVRDGTVRSCVGINFGASDGLVPGSLLALDPKPRSWTRSQLAFVREIAAVIEDELETAAVGALPAPPDVSSRSGVDPGREP